MTALATMAQPLAFARRLALVCGLALACGGCGGQSREQVVVYVAVDRAAAEPILRAFEAQTGIQARALYDAETAKTTGLTTRLLAELDRPRCDVFWNNELAQTLLLAQRGALAPYASPAAADVPDDFKSPDALWTGVGMRARVIVYNTRYVTEADAPRSLAELAQPRWRGKVAVANPQFGTTRAHVAAMFAVMGPPAAQQFLLDLLANEATIVDGNARVRSLVASADPPVAPIVVGLTDTDDVLAGQAQGEPLGMIFPDQDSLGTLVVPTSVALIEGAPHALTARRLIDYLVGPAVESALTAESSGYAPLRPAPNQTFFSHERPPRAMKVTWAELLEHLEPGSLWTREHFHDD